jgi:ABC-type multidrug transport system fused ATPase/permease subunit
VLSQRVSSRPTLKRFGCTRIVLHLICAALLTIASASPPAACSSFIASPRVGALLVLPLVGSNLLLLFPYSKVLARIDAASIACRAQVNGFLHERVRFDRTVTLSGQSNLELQRLDAVLGVYEVATMDVLHSSTWILLSVVNALSRQAVIAVVSPFVLLWLRQESGLEFKDIWLISVYMQSLTMQAEMIPPNVGNLLASYRDLKSRGARISTSPLPKPETSPNVSPPSADAILAPDAVIAACSDNAETPNPLRDSDSDAATQGSSGSAHPSLETSRDVADSSQRVRPFGFGQPEDHTLVFAKIVEGEFAPILAGLSLSIPLRKVTAIYGPSGSGVSVREAIE